MKAETLEENYQALSELYSNIRKELERTRKALDVAVVALRDFSIHPDDGVRKYAKKFLDEITALEQKDK